MRRGTTPTHTFQIPVDVSELTEVKIIYAQSNREVLSKRKADCSVTDKGISVELTQAETLKFSDGTPCQIQVRLLTTGGAALASDIITIKVDPILDGGVLV